MNNVLAGEAVLEACVAAMGDGVAAWSERPRSPMMTVSGIAAEGPPAADETRRIAGEGVSPQFTAVFGLDTEQHFALIPVMMKSR